MIYPYRKKINSEYSKLDTNTIRWSKTLDFIGKCDKAKSGLDIGDRSSFTVELENVFLASVTKPVDRCLGVGSGKLIVLETRETTETS